MGEERFDKPIANLFDMQDEIVSPSRQPARQELAGVEAKRAEREPIPIDGSLLPWARPLQPRRSRIPSCKPVPDFDRALELDPNNARRVGPAGMGRSHPCRGLVDQDRFSDFAPPKPTLARRSIEARPCRCPLRSGAVQILTLRADRGIAECERASRRSTRTSLLPTRGSALRSNLSRRNEETEAHILEELRIQSRDTYAFFWMLIVGFAQLGGGCYEGAVAWLSRSIGLNRGHPTPHCLLAAALASLGRIEEAAGSANRGSI